MANFGFADLRLVNPYDLAFREAVSAVGGAHVLQAARVYASAGRSRERLRPRDWHHRGDKAANCSSRSNY